MNLDRIPEDIRKKAAGIVAEIESECDVYYPDAVTDVIAQALFGERKRAADIARSADRPGRNTGSLISEAILDHRQIGERE